ncbi:MAG: glycosyltransferase family 4 protein [Anaerolineae bacterium]|nr:glycosyltransferase family 4 protein [Anaerolineae bacterium]
MDAARQRLVAFNAHLLSAGDSYRSAGIAVYVTNLLRGLAAVESNLRYQVLLGDQRLSPADFDLPVRFSRVSTAHPVKRILWEQGVLPVLLRRLGAELLHAPAFVGPLLSSCPQVITVHDLSFLRHPEFFRRGNRLYLRTLTGVACRRAAAVIAVSRFTATEIQHLLRVPAARIHTIYHGIDPRFHPLPPAEVVAFRRGMQLPDRFVLYLGTLEPRKNLKQLVRAFALLRDPDVHLVLVGGRGWLYEDIFAEVERLGLGERVHFPGFVPTETQALWYNAAEAFAYISHYEGFGFPVAEALACGTPTLTMATTSLPEAGGDGVLLIDPGDQTPSAAAPDAGAATAGAESTEAAIADGLHRLLVDAPLRAELRQRGLAHAARFSWAETARQTEALYRQVLEARKG